MDEELHVDYIRKIIDEDQELLALITQSEQNALLFKLQINIQDSFTPEFKFSTFHSLKLNYPTPCQYAIIANKHKSLKGLINFLCNKREDYHCFALPKYEHGLQLDIKSVFCPTISNTTWPLLHLAIGLGRKECLNVLIDFLKNQNKLSEFINYPDDYQRTPLTIAFATGINEIIDPLLKNDADPYYFDNNVIMPFIYTCLHSTKDQVEQVIQLIQKYHINENPFKKIEKYYFDDNGFAYNKEENGVTKLDDLLKKVLEVRELYNKTKEGQESIPIIESSDDTIKKNDKKQCCVCNNQYPKVVRKCPSCGKYFCETHFENDEVHADVYH